MARNQTQTAVNDGGTVAPGTRTPPTDSSKAWPVVTEGNTDTNSGKNTGSVPEGNDDQKGGLLGLDIAGRQGLGNGNPGANGASTGATGTAAAQPRSTGFSDATLLKQQLADQGVGVQTQPYKLPEVSDPSAKPVDRVDTAELKGMLQQILDSQKQQSQQQIDYGVEQGVNELTRAMEDAAQQYQTQRNQIAADEARAKDNQALYAEARGDRGGIGAAQYDSIQNTAALNRRAVNDAQVKLGTDTARQIADLRSQGEFQKADQLLSITQNYLSQLMNLEQWAMQANIGVDEFNAQLRQWADEYNLNVQKFLTDLDLSAAQLTGVFANGARTLAYQNQLDESLANSGAALLSAGVMPSRQQLKAMGMTETQAKAYLNKTGL